MALKINMQGWKTAPSGTNLCLTCKYANVIQGHQESQTIIKCNQIGKKMQWKVTECSSYLNQNMPSLGSMIDMAFIIEQKKGGGIGFVRSKAFRDKHGWDALDAE